MFSAVFILVSMLMDRSRFFWRSRSFWRRLVFSFCRRGCGLTLRFLVWDYFCCYRNIFLLGSFVYIVFQLAPAFRNRYSLIGNGLFFFMMKLFSWFPGPFSFFSPF